MPLRPAWSRWLTVAVVLACAGCSAAAGTSSRQPVTSPASASPAAASASAAADTPETTDAPETTTPAPVTRLGDTVTYDDGLKVTVSVRRFRVGAYAAGGKPGSPGVIVTVVLANGTSEPFDAALTSVHVTWGPDGEQATQVFDMQAGLPAAFDGKISPGRRATARWGFAVPAAGLRDLQIEVTPGFLGHDAAMFSGSA